MERFHAILKWVYSLVILVLPIYSVIFLHTNSHALTIVTEKQLGFLQSSYFLVVLFTLFMLVLLQNYLPDTTIGMLELLLTPALIGALQALISPASAQEYIAELGMLHIATIMLAFMILVSFIFIMGVIGMIQERKWDGNVFWGLIGMCGAQLLFIIPGGGAIYIFGKYIYVQEIIASSPTGTIWHWSALLLTACYIGSILHATWLFGKKLKSESIVG